MAFKTISNEERIGKGVSGLSDTPNMEASELQSKFDELGNMAIDEANAIADLLNDESGARNVGASVPDGVNASNNVQSIIDAIARRTAHADEIMHTHNNKPVLDSITNAVKSGYDRLVTMLFTITSVGQVVTDDIHSLPTGHAIVNYVSSMGGGDMTSSTYDPEKTGVVVKSDDSNKLAGQDASFYATQDDMDDISETIQSINNALDNKLDGSELVSNYDAVKEGGTDVDVPSTSLIHQLIANFTDGVESIYNKLVANGSTPKSKTLADVVDAIDTIRADGSAEAREVAFGKTFWSGKEFKIGSMSSFSGKTYTPSASEQVIFGDKYLSGNIVISGDANLVSNNIKAETTIFGVSGNSNVVDTASGNITRESMLEGRIAFSKGREITGSIPEIQSETIELPVDGSYLIPMGYHDGTGRIVNEVISRGNLFLTAEGSTGIQHFDIADGYYTSIDVDRTAAYEAGYERGNADASEGVSVFEDIPIEQCGTVFTEHGEGKDSDGYYASNSRIRINIFNDYTAYATKYNIVFKDIKAVYGRFNSFTSDTENFGTYSIGYVSGNGNSTKCIIVDRYAVATGGGEGIILRYKIYLRKIKK